MERITSTGGQFLYLTPVVSFAVAPGTNLYGLQQLPLLIHAGIAK